MLIIVVVPEELPIQVQSSEILRDISVSFLQSTAGKYEGLSNQSPLMIKCTTLKDFICRVIQILYVAPKS